MTASGTPRTAGEMLTLVVRSLTARLDYLEPAAVSDEHDAVHQARTTVRRLRNLLAGFRDLVERPASKELRARLAQFGEVLGGARDLEVRVEQLRSVAYDAGLGEDEVDGLVEPLCQQHATAHRAVVSWWRGPAGQQLQEELAAWSDNPPLTDDAERPADSTAYDVLRKQARRTTRAAGEVRDLDASHELRKAGRRLRHLAEAVTEEPAAVLGKRARKLGEAGQQVQLVLGDQRDATLLAAHLRAADADDRLVEVCEQRAAAAAAVVDDAVAELRRRKRRFKDLDL